MLGFADDPARPAPAVEGGVDEPSEAPRRLAGLGMRGGRGGQIGVERRDQARIAREAKDVVDAVRLAPRHQLVAGKAGVRTQQDLDPWPRRADATDDAGHLGHSARRSIDVRGPHQGREEMPTTEHVQGQIAVAAVVAVEEPTLLLTV